MLPVPYRVRQVWQRARHRLSDAERAWLCAHLTPAEQGLFFAQEPGDQGHAFSVARTLHAQGYDDARLLVAALLHDAGKAPAVPLVFRTVRVLAGRLAPGMLARVRPDTRGWLAPLARAVHHPALGANLAQRAGSHPDTVALILHHQEPNPPLPPDLLPFLRALQAVDDAS